LTFQLVSLFDLLIIIVFAQYFDLQDKTRAQLAAASEHASPAAEALQRELDERNRELAALKAEGGRKQLELGEELKRSRDDLARLGALVAELFDLPAEPLDKMLRARGPEEADRIRKTLKELAANRSSNAVRHILTLAELEKRCDIWQIHIRDDGGYVFTADERKARFRAETPEKFAAELFKQYKGLPQPKSLVLMLLSWGDAELKARTAAVDGLEIAAERMRADSDRRSRFESAILGYIPSGEP
jgi:phage pi2 protein 07